MDRSRALEKNWLWNYEDVIKFLKNVFARHGIPELLVTDNGPQFCSYQTKAFLDLHDIFPQCTVVLKTRFTTFRIIFK